MAPLDYKSSLTRYSRYLQAVSGREMWKASLYLILSLLLMIILLLVALRPTLVTISGLFGQIHQEQELEKKLDAKIQAVTEANQNLLAITSRLSVLDQALPSKAEVANWTSAVERVGNENGVEVPQISFFTVPVVTESTTSASYSFTLTARGQYSQLHAFLQTLQNLRRLISIESVILSTQTVTSGQVDLNIKGSLGSHL